MILLQSLKTNFSLTDKIFYSILLWIKCMLDMPRLIITILPLDNLLQLSGNTHKCEMLYMVSTRGFQ